MTMPLRALAISISIAFALGAPVSALAEGPPVTQSVPRFVGWSAGAALEALHKAFGIKSEPQMTRFVANILCKSHWFDICAARRELGYEPHVSTSEGLRRLKVWFRRAGSARPPAVDSRTH